MAHSDHTQVSKHLIGLAGRYYVLFRLSQQGILATLAAPRTALVDVLVTSVDKQVIATLKVKTTTAGLARGWTMTPEQQNFCDDRAFLRVRPSRDATQWPVTYIVPSRRVANVLQEGHRIWLATPGVKGRKHRDNPVRKFQPAYEVQVPGWGPAELDQYRERWDLLRAPVRTEV
jgi:hypothetical protein